MGAVLRQAPGVVSETAAEALLQLYNTHTNEKIDIVYRRGDRYRIQGALAKPADILCATTTRMRCGILIRVLTISSDLTASVGHPAARLILFAGIGLLRRMRCFASIPMAWRKNSLHIQAEAIDLRMPGNNTLRLRKAALALARGGVGYYPHSDFIHVDTGACRQWCFDCPASLINGD